MSPASPAPVDTELIRLSLFKAKLLVVIATFPATPWSVVEAVNKEVWLSIITLSKALIIIFPALPSPKLLVSILALLVRVTDSVALNSIVPPWDSEFPNSGNIPEKIIVPLSATVIFLPCKEIVPP